jgi:ferritin-like metal-binding protein YciE
MQNAYLHDLFVEQIQDLYSAEHQLIEVLPKMVEAAESSSLADALQDHWEETKVQAQRLEQIAERLDVDLKNLIGGDAKKCKGMEGCIKEGQEVLSKWGEESVLRDLAIIAAAQRVEHYEIAGYGTARTLAEEMGHDTAVDLLEETLEEESAADETLTDVATALMADASDEEV